MSLKTTWLIASLSALTTACAPTGIEEDEFIEDEFAQEESVEALDGKPDNGGENFTYFEVEKDLRDCTFPACGGLWIQRLNHASTVCFDGTEADRCYVAEMNIDGLGLTETEENELTDAITSGAALVRGRIVSQNDNGSGNLEIFEATEAWVAGSDAKPEGFFSRVRLNGLKCVTFPCPSLTEYKVNSIRSADIAEIDFSPMGLTQDQYVAAYDALRTADGVIIAGDRIAVDGPAGRAAGRSVTQFFTRLAPPL